VSGGWLDRGHGGAAAYPGNDEDDSGVARSDKHGRKWSGGFRHELSGRRAKRGERPAIEGGQNRTATLDQKLSSSELHADITHKQHRFSILLDVVVGVHGYEVSRFGESINNHPNRVKFAGS
jgi:hypothetical protein